MVKIGYCNGEEARVRSLSIDVEERAKAVPGPMRAGRQRSRGHPRPLRFPPKGGSDGKKKPRADCTGLL